MAEPTNMSGSTTDTKSKKKRKNKKKGTTVNANPSQNGNHGAETDAQPPPIDPTEREGNDSGDSENEMDESDAPQQTGASTETSLDDDAIATVTNDVEQTKLDSTEAEGPTTRFDVLVKDRDALRAEVTQLRQSLEQLQAKHGEEMEILQTELKESQEEKDNAQEEYQNLLEKVNTIRSHLGERLKANAEELAQARTLIDELEEQKADLQEQYTVRSAEIEELTSTKRAQEKELTELRNRSSLSQQNWIRERDELLESEAYIREEYENAKSAMHDWEVLATEERQKKRDLERRIGDLEEQLSLIRSDYDRAADERDTQSTTVEGLQRALQEIQEARRKELREIVENSQSEIQNVQKQLDETNTENEKSKTELEETKKELERTAPFEKEVKEKNLLLGKLRHETVILSDHLTKALRFMKKGRAEDNVDRQVVTNYFMQFLSLDRSDPKKFQVLQVIAGLLDWTDEQKQQAGLARPGASSASTTGSMRLPKTPGVHRAPSTSSLMGPDYFAGSDSTVTSPSGKESLAELWQSFLEQEATSNSIARGSLSVASGRPGSASGPPSTVGTSK